MRAGIKLVFAAAWALATASLVTGTTAVAQEAPAPTVVTAIQAGRLLANPATGLVLRDQTVLITSDGRISAIVPGFQAPAGATVIDQRQRFVLPGLIDSHVHILSPMTSGGPAQARVDAATRTTAYVALRGAQNALVTARAGFTTIVDLGGDSEAVFALRDAIREGITQGPRIIAAGRAITPHAGHGDAQGWRPDVMELMRSPSACSGADDCRRATRQMIQAGADIIKITATGGVLSDTAAGLGQQLTDDEMAAIVDAAHAMGRQVVAHAHSVEGINAALRAGVDGIEHGTYLNEDSIRLFRRNNAFLVPTVLAGITVYERAQIPGALTPAQRMKALEVGPRMLDMLTRAHAGGVRVAFGTDSGVSRHGDNAREFELMVQAGFTPIDAIRAATVLGAQHLRLETEIGQIAPGFSADIIAVDGDPTANVSELRSVDFVMARGQVLSAD
jgi:imidazolonepropionase-like amidohydrolase